MMNWKGMQKTYQLTGKKKGANKTKKQKYQIYIITFIMVNLKIYKKIKLKFQKKNIFSCKV